MDNRDLYYYLLVTEKTMDVTPLNEICGLNYSNIKELSDYCKKNGLIIKKNKEIYLTNEGKKMLKILRKELDVRGNSNYIAEYRSAMFGSLPVDTIILEE